MGVFRYGPKSLPGNTIGAAIRLAPFADAVRYMLYELKQLRVLFLPKFVKRIANSDSEKRESE